MPLSRQDYILKCIVEYFIKTATPVGSETLIKAYNLDYSSATIRNDMKLLESQGLIEKTHTSSGRIPSSKGYHYYIENLKTTSLDDELKDSLTRILSEKAKSVEDVIKESCETISHMTNLASVVLGPNADEECLLSVQIIPLSSSSATAVFVTDKGYVENKTFVFDAKTDINDIQKCVEMLNTRLKGTKISELIDKMEAMRPLIAQYVKSNDMIYRAFVETFVKFASERVSLFGTENLLNQPEFSDDAEKIKKMIQFIESPKKMHEALNTNEEMLIKIGNDDGTDTLEDVTFISRKIPMGKNKGTIALLGPTRMDYELVVNALDYLAEELSKFFDDRKDEEE